MKETKKALQQAKIDLFNTIGTPTEILKEIWRDSESKWVDVTPKDPNKDVYQKYSKGYRPKLDRVVKTQVNYYYHQGCRVPKKVWENPYKFLKSNNVVYRESAVAIIRFGILDLTI